MITSELTGTVLAVQANYYRVRLDLHNPEVIPENCQELLCIRRSRLKKIGQDVYVGDRVIIEEPDWQGQRGAIADILPRQSLLDRPKIANIDRILLVFALADPELDPMQLSRFLVKAEASNLNVNLCLSKCDLVTPAQCQAWSDRLQTWGYTPALISTYTGQGIEELRSAYLSQGVTVISGPSGVGKSSLINLLIPKLDLRVGEVSQRLGHGKHTTRHVELFAIGKDGFLADTPGFIQPSLTCDPTDLVHCFPEARQRLELADCQFHNCRHLTEPNCVVRGDWERYAHYGVFREEVVAHADKFQAYATPEASTKSKSGTKGQLHQEPRLVTKRDRRLSRRSAHQELHSTEHEDI